MAFVGAAAQGHSTVAHLLLLAPCASHSARHTAKASEIHGEGKTPIRRVFRALSPDTDGQKRWQENTGPGNLFSKYVFSLERPGHRSI